MELAIGLGFGLVSYVDVDEPVPVLGGGEGAEVVFGLESALEPAAVELALHLHNHIGAAFRRVRVSRVNQIDRFLRHLLFIINKVSAASIYVGP